MDYNQSDKIAAAINRQAEAQRELALATVFAAAYTSHAGKAGQTSLAIDAMEKFKRYR